MICNKLLGCVISANLAFTSLLTPMLAVNHANKIYKHSDSSSCSSHKKSSKKKLDYIIVGAGTAGLACAWALTNDKKTSVLVLEAGEDLTSDPVVLNPNIFETFDPLTYNPKYGTTSVTTDNPQRVIYSRGTMIGGSSGHNYLQAMRGTPDSYNEWAVISGNPEWSYNSMLPLFKNQEHYKPNGTTADTSQRGLTGRLYISQQDPFSPQPPFLQAVASAYNIPFIDDYNDHYEISPGVYANTVGVSANQQWTTDYCASQNCGVRSYSGNTYLKGIPSVGLPPVVNAKNTGINGRKLSVKTSSTVSRILFKGKKAVGVEVIENKNGKIKTYNAKAKRGVILSAGAVATPAILQRSGVGKASDLAPLGIDIVINNPNVGYNGENQYGVDVLIKEHTPLNPLTLNPCFNDLGQGDGVRRALLDVLPGAFVPSMVLGVIGLTPGEVFVGYSDLLTFLVRPKSQAASVVIQTPDPLTPPYIDLNMFSDTAGPGGTSQDLADCITSFKLAQAVAAAQGGGPNDILYPINDHYPAPWGPAPDDSLLENDAKSNPHFADHLSCTCRMSSSPVDGVVDGELKVFGAKNLYIADCSVQPHTIDASTNYVSFFIGLKLAKFLGANLP